MSWLWAKVSLESKFTVALPSMARAWPPVTVAASFVILDRRLSVLILSASEWDGVLFVRSVAQRFVQSVLAVRLAPAAQVPDASASRLLPQPLRNQHLLSPGSACACFHCFARLFDQSEAVHFGPATHLVTSSASFTEDVSGTFEDSSQS